jgi:hypothetical protein
MLRQVLATVTYGRPQNRRPPGMRLTQRVRLSLLDHPLAHEQMWTCFQRVLDEPRRNVETSTMRVTTLRCRLEVDPGTRLPCLTFVTDLEHK